MSSQPEHHVVIVGSGFGGLFAAKALRLAPVRVTLLDRTNHHLFQPLLYQVATGILSPGDIAPATRDVLRRQRNVTVQLGEVSAIDPELRQLEVRHPSRNRTTIGYDSLIVASGVTQSYFGNDRFAQWAPGMKTIDDALALRARIFGAFELAEWEADPAARARLLTFAIVGAGPTGVELAGQLGELSRRALAHNFRRLDPREARILLFDAGDRILPSFHERLSTRAARDLTRLGVDIRLRTTVTDLDELGITVHDAEGNETRIEAITKIWASGVQAAPLAALLAEVTGAPVDARGRLRVTPDCSLPGRPEIFVVGDAMALDGLPGLAEVAMQSGRHAARVIAARVTSSPPRGPFRYHDLGSMAAVSRTSGVVEYRRLRLGGRVGWMLWLVVHLTFLTGFKNRFSTLLQWTITFLSRGRGERTITLRQAGLDDPAGDSTAPLARDGGSR